MMKVTDMQSYHPTSWVLSNFLVGIGIAVGVLSFGTIFQLGAIFLYDSMLFVPVNLGCLLCAIWLQRSGALQKASAYLLFAIGMLLLFPLVTFIAAIPYIADGIPWSGGCALAALVLTYKVSVRACVAGTIGLLYGVYVGLLLYNLLLLLLQQLQGLV